MCNIISDLGCFNFLNKALLTLGYENSLDKVLKILHGKSC